MSDRTLRSKRQSVETPKSPTKVKKVSKDEKEASSKVKKVSSAELNLYFKTYQKKGAVDFHLDVFKGVNNIVKPSRVLYPGCHRHVTASLVFNDVVYVDNYSKIKSCFIDEKVLDWVSSNKEYKEKAEIKFIGKNFESDFGEKVESFDLLMSLSAGIVTTSCSKYVKKLGYVLVSDAHFDARMLYLDLDFELTHVWDSERKKFDDDADALSGHFTTMDGKAITKDQVQESIDKPKAKRSFKLQKEILFYLFQKVEQR